MNHQNCQSYRSLKRVILFTTLYFSHTGWSRFQTDQSITENRHLIRNDVKFQWSVFIFLNRDFHAFVLTKFPLSLFIIFLVHTSLTPISWLFFQSYSTTSLWSHKSPQTWKGLFHASYSFNNCYSALWHFSISGRINSTYSK